jgi:hypothetical protein
MLTYHLLPAPGLRTRMNVLTWKKIPKKKMQKKKLQKKKILNLILWQEDFLMRSDALLTYATWK